MEFLSINRLWSIIRTILLSVLPILHMDYLLPCYMSINWRERTVTGSCWQHRVKYRIMGFLPGHTHSVYVFRAMNNQWPFIRWLCSRWFLGGDGWFSLYRLFWSLFWWDIMCGNLLHWSRKYTRSHPKKKRKKKRRWNHILQKKNIRPTVWAKPNVKNFMTGLLLMWRKKNLILIPTWKWENLPPHCILLPIPCPICSINILISHTMTL